MATRPGVPPRTHPQRLRDMAMGAVRAQSFDSAVQAILETVVDAVGADRGNIQILDGWGETLEIMAQVGFEDAFLDRFRFVRREDETACGRTLRTRRRNVVEDVLTDADYAPYRDAAAEAGYRAVQSTPLIDAKGSVVGVLSTHYIEPRTFDDRELALIDAYTSDAVDLIVNLQERDALRERERRMAFLATLAEASARRTDPLAIQGEVSRLLGSYLGATRAFYGEADGEVVTIEADYHDGVGSAAGRYRLTDFGRDVRDALFAGRTLAVDDVDAEEGLTDDERARYHQIQIRAHVTVPFVRDGRLIALVGVRQDRPRRWKPSEIELVTEVAQRAWDSIGRARAEADLRERQERFSTLFNSIDQGLCICELILDGDGRPADYRFLEVNRAFAEITRLHDVQGRTAREMLPGLEPEWVERYGNVVLTGEPTRFEASSADLGQWFDAYASPVGPPAGLQFAIVFTDITSRRRAEEERRKLLEEARTARREAEDANRSKSIFLANMSHELRTPLNAILGYSDLLIAGVPDALPERARTQVERVRSSAVHLMALIEEVLTFAKVEAGHTRLHRETVNMNDLVLRTAELLEPLARAKDLSFEVHLPPRPLTVVTDAARVRQILLNLFSNAVKFTDAGGVAVTLGNGADRADIAVRDTGCGIEASSLDLIFEPFRQLDEGKVRRHGGTGLGLSVSRELARLLGGDILVRSEARQGSTFTLSLPRNADGRSPEAPPIA